MSTIKKIKTIGKIIGSSYSKKVVPSLNYINISITSLCNLNCVMCEARDFKKECYISMPYSTFKKIIDETVPLGLEVINLAATGESTIHTDFARMVEYAAGKKIKLRLVTNLNYANESIFNALSKFEQIHVSIDGCTKETYEKIRRGASWEKLTENIKKLRQINKKARLVVNFCVQKDNYKELPLLCKTFLPIGFDEINVGWLMDQNQLHDKQKILGEDWDKFLKICEEANREFKKNNMPIPRVIDTERLKKISNPQVLRLGYEVFGIPCYHYHFSMYIAPNGNVYPCCFFDYHEGFTGEKTLCAGNVNLSSLKEIWTGEKMNSIRAQLLKKQFPKECIYCSNKINKDIHNLVKNFARKQK